MDFTKYLPLALAVYRVRECGSEWVGAAIKGGIWFFVASIVTNILAGIVQSMLRTLTGGKKNPLAPLGQVTGYVPLIMCATIVFFATRCS